MVCDQMRRCLRVCGVSYERVVRICTQGLVCVVVSACIFRILPSVHLSIFLPLVKGLLVWLAAASSTSSHPANDLQVGLRPSLTCNFTFAHFSIHFFILTKGSISFILQNEHQSCRVNCVEPYKTPPCKTQIART